MKSLKAQIYVAVVCAVLGLMLAYQFQAVKNFSIQANSKKVEDLSNQLSIAEQQKANLEKNVTGLENKINEYQKNATTSNGIAKNLKDDLDQLKIIAGMTKVEGSGIVVTISPQAQKFSTNDQPVIVGYQDLLITINELNSAGAEAIMVNNQRIVSTTQIRNAGSNFIIINDVKFPNTENFIIDAIGDSTTLEGAINLSGGIKNELSQYGLNITTQKVNNITILKSNKVVDFKYAKPVKEGE